MNKKRGRGWPIIKKNSSNITSILFLDRQFKSGLEVDKKVSQTEAADDFLSANDWAKNKVLNYPSTCFALVSLLRTHVEHHTPQFLKFAN